MQGIGSELRIICDYAAALQGIEPVDNLTLLTSCHGVAYLQHIFDATLVVVPLAIEDISAGQMVLIQAKALGKALIVTDSPTVRDYVVEGHDAILVPRGDPLALRAAILMLLDNPGERERLGRNARASFERDFTTEQSVKALITTIDRHFRQDNKSVDTGC